MPKQQDKLQKINRVAKELFVYAFILFLLVLTSANLNNYFQPKSTKVLGAETESKDEAFWGDFLTKNPNYIPGWIESGRLDKVKEIDPNYFIQDSLIP